MCLHEWTSRAFIPPCIPPARGLDCLSRTSTESNSVGTLEAHFQVRGAKSMPTGLTFQGAGKNAGENRHGTHVAEHSRAWPETAECASVWSNNASF